ncbi:hypothetical protein HK102_010796, partial [Quaeritorhiza haematococci]
SRDTLENLRITASAVDSTELTEREQADLEFLKDAIEVTLVEFDEGGYEYEIPSSHMGVLGSLQMMFSAYQPLSTPTDFDHYTTRLSKFPTRFSQLITAYRAGITRGVTLPHHAITHIINLCASQIVAYPSESPFNFSEKAKEVMGDEHYLDKWILEYVVPAYQGLKAFMEEEYIKHARKTPGIFGLPNAQQVYQSQIFRHTSTRYTASELHQIGLAEVSRINSEIDALALRICPEAKTRQEFRAALMDRDRFPTLYIENKEDIIPMYERLLEEIDGKMEGFFARFPKFRKSDIVAVPKEAEGGAPLAMYQPGTKDK